MAACFDFEPEALKAFYAALIMPLRSLKIVDDLIDALLQQIIYFPLRLIGVSK